MPSHAPNCYTPRMDRLRTKTWRWSDGVSTEGYDALELAGGTLTYFSWSHEFGEGGRREHGRQTTERFLRDGPLVTVPPHILTELRRILGS